MEDDGSSPDRLPASKLSRSLRPCILSIVPSSMLPLFSLDSGVSGDFIPVVELFRGAWLQIAAVICRKTCFPVLLLMRAKVVASLKCCSQPTSLGGALARCP